MSGIILRHLMKRGMEFDGSGHAYFLILGTKGSEGPTVNFNLTSITLKGGGEAPNNTDGVTEGE